MGSTFGKRLLRLGHDCDALLERRTLRVALSIVILASLLPVGALERLDGAFLVLFSCEFALRVLAVLAASQGGEFEFELEPEGLEPDAPRSRRSLASALGLLAIDAIALVSFMPLAVGPDGARWLRVVRLLRLLALVGYWRRLLRDTWSILVRRERLRQVGLMGVVVGGLSFAGALVLHHLHDAPFDADEDGELDGDDRRFWVLLWWSFRQVQDPGNMLGSPQVLPAVLVSLGLTVFGLMLVSFLIGLGSDVVRELVEHSRMRPPGFVGHTVVVNITPSTQRLLYELMSYYRKLFPEGALLRRRWWADLFRRGLVRQRFVLIGESLEAPEFLREHPISRVAYRPRPLDEELLIARADLLSAKRVLLLAEADVAGTGVHPDAQTIRMLLTLVERVRAAERTRRIPALRRTRVVIAEILDESNVAAAHAALATAGTSFRGWVVPTEKLLGLFFAGVVRRPGLGDLLAILLTSVGHELYTCFFDVPGLGFQVTRPAGVGGPAGAVMRRLARVGPGVGGSHGPVIPVGVLLDRPGSASAVDIVLNPDDSLVLDESRVRGFIGVAGDFLAVRRWVDAFAGATEATAEGVVVGTPVLARTRRPKTTRVLVCGFRAGTIYMLEELFRSDPAGEVLVLVDDDDARRTAVSRIDAHSQLVTRELLPRRHAVFEPAGLAEYVVRLPESPQTAGRLRLEVADWMASRHLVDLPGGFGHVAGLDAIVFVAGDAEASDPRTTTALLKLEQLCCMDDGVATPAVVVEVFDAALAARLSARARALRHTHVQVFSSQELRAFFLFQAVAVPGFDAVYEELLGAWGQSLVHMHVETPGTGECTFAALSARLAERRHILIAVELEVGRVLPQLCVAPGTDEPGHSFAAQRLRGAWVIAPDWAGDRRADERGMMRG